MVGLFDCSMRELYNFMSILVEVVMFCASYGPWISDDGPSVLLCPTRETSRLV
jgi:hypothetical protein